MGERGSRWLEAKLRADPEKQGRLFRDWKFFIEQLKEAYGHRGVGYGALAKIWQLRMRSDQAGEATDLSFLTCSETVSPRNYASSSKVSRLTTSGTVRIDQHRLLGKTRRPPPVDSSTRRHASKSASSRFPLPQQEKGNTKTTAPAARPLPPHQAQQLAGCKKLHGHHVRAQLVPQLQGRGSLGAQLPVKAQAED
ncbi:uncharacterized protein UMAG_04257 [Mycosarcoma maydis]|uniref:Uncharacterized protein n=1 Tax=Mycosarcoma maydis TaxID=5270 RepID=A0A0D1C1P7_MYCMD|nr:uncharacterized protein UMAG_04257 [Ustilago maydis 521]KIS67762.1 hypothetical protein UMAG_04257 [Ustilago maydis 521]|eukprot:XP_011390726.1 hypothetical protein UMAG_04257 [Ustilago maydis 521]